MKLFILLILILFMMFLLNHLLLVGESFINPPKIQNGVSPSTSSGTIQFATSFQNTPLVMTQPISGNSNVSSIVNITNTTPSGFQYSKGIIKNVDSEEFSAVSYGEDMNSLFSWIAMDVSQPSERCCNVCSESS